MGVTGGRVGVRWKATKIGSAPKALPTLGIKTRSKEPSERDRLFYFVETTLHYSKKSYQPDSL